MNHFDQAEVMAESLRNIEKFSNDIYEKGQEMGRLKAVEKLLTARLKCSPFYADGLDHAIDILEGKIDV